MPANCLDDDFREAYLARRSKRLLAALPQTADPFRGIVSPLGERRSREQFTFEVDRFVDAARDRWVSFAVVKAVEEGKPALKFVLVNSTDDNFEAVQVEVTLPFPHVLVFASADEARDRARPPTEPARWGEGTSTLLAEVRPAIRALHGPGIEPARKDATIVRFEPVHVRPRSRHPLLEVIVAALPSLGGTTLTAVWRATSTSTRGELTGGVDFVVDASPDAPVPR